MARAMVSNQLKLIYDQIPLIFNTLLAHLADVRFWKNNCIWLFVGVSKNSRVSDKQCKLGVGFAACDRFAQACLF